MPARALALALLCACAAPVVSAPVERGPRPFDPAGALHMGHRAPLPASFGRAHRGPPPPSDSATLLAPLGGSLSGGVFDEGYGEDLVAALADQPAEDLAEYGAGTLTFDQLFGADYDAGEGLCQDPHATFTFEDGGATWETSLLIYGLLQLVEPVQALMMELSEGCTAGVDAAGGDVEAAVSAGSCSEEELHGFFPEGGACRACLSDGASVEGCQDAGDCQDEAPQAWEVDGAWYEWAETTVLACAPDTRMKLYLAAWDLPDDGSVPEAWDQSSWPELCFAMREEDTGEIGLQCVTDGDGTDEITDGYGDGVVGRFDWLREEGATDTPHEDRVIYASSLSFEDGTTTSQFVLSFGGIGQISAPLYPTDCDDDGDVDDDDWGCGYGGWGMSPVALRPDGSDPTNLDDTYARDWLGGVVTKMSTTRNGVPINNMNYSRCEAWVGPADDGSWTCVKNGKPRLGWFVDNHVFWYNHAHTMIQAEPMMTLGSTGLPDELVPGGFTPHLAGTAALANPYWDDCLWPHEFVADHIRTEDTPIDWSSPTSLDAHTYKWGKDPDQDLRMVLATPQARGFCPEG